MSRLERARAALLAAEAGARAPAGAGGAPSREESAGRASSGRRRAAARTLDREALRAVALRYLDRYDASRARLREVLERAVLRARRRNALAEGEPDRWVEEIVARLAEAGVVDDARYAENLVRAGRARGASRRALEHRLAARGVSDEARAQGLLSADRDDPEPELNAARALLRRRRLSPGTDVTSQRRALAALARAGFSLDVARRALGAERLPDAES